MHQHCGPVLLTGQLLQLRLPGHSLFGLGAAQMQDEPSSKYARDLMRRLLGDWIREIGFCQTSIRTRILDRLRCPAEDDRIVLSALCHLLPDVVGEIDE